METQIHSYYLGPKGSKLVTIFGYATKGVPGIEVNGVTSLSRNIREKIIYLTRIRKLVIPTKRFVICVDVNDMDERLNWNQLKWLEFPILLVFWHLAGLIPISSLKDCMCSGWMNTIGEVNHIPMPDDLLQQIHLRLDPIERKKLKLITVGDDDDEFWTIDPSMLLEHIPDLTFKMHGSYR